MTDREFLRISELLLYCCNGSAGPDEMAELESLLEGNREALEYCVDVLMDLNYFHCLAQTPLSQPESSRPTETDFFMCELDPQEQLALLGDFAEYEKRAAAMKIAPPAKPAAPPSAEKAPCRRQERTVNKYSLAAAILSAAALLMIIVYAHLAPGPASEVAAVLDSIDAEWSAGLPAHAGSRLAADAKPIRLTRGLVKLQTDEMVNIVLEAPTEFLFRSSSEIVLHYGKLFARVSEQGSGFSVVTPNSKIVDLGTEFGVVCHLDGNTDVHLYLGRANLFAGEKQKRKISELLAAGSARRVDSLSAAIREITLNEQALARHIDSKSKFVWRGQRTLCLADLLLGGNGFGTAEKQSIEYDPADGSIAESGVVGYRPSPVPLAAVKESPYIDSLFVPDSRGGEIQVSTAGHRFTGCPETSGLYYSNACCLKDWRFFEPLQQKYEQSRKRNADSGALYLHSNLGMTIDLDAVRRTVPGLRIASFSAFAGILRVGKNLPDYAEADVWVLIDGQLRASRKQLRAEDGFEIYVPLADSDRFLTLLVTDGGRVLEKNWPANHLDTCGFAEPVFELVPR